MRRLLVRVRCRGHGEPRTGVSGQSCGEAHIVDIAVHVAGGKLAASDMQGSRGIVDRRRNGTVAPFERAVEVEPHRTGLPGDGYVVPAVRLKGRSGLFSRASSKFPWGRAVRIEPEREFSVRGLFVELQRHPLEIVFRKDSLVQGADVVEPYPSFHRPVGRAEVLPSSVGYVKRIAATVERDARTSEHALGRRQLRVAQRLDGVIVGRIDDVRAFEFQKHRGVRVRRER